MGTKIACVRCGNDVKGPAVPASTGHTGHVDTRLDQACGWWGYRRKSAAAMSLGRKGGKVSSPAKTAAVRANGRLGGRPKNDSGNLRHT